MMKRQPPSKQADNGRIMACKPLEMPFTSGAIMARPGARWLICWLPLAAACSDLTRPGLDRGASPSAAMAAAPAPSGSQRSAAGAATGSAPVVADAREITASHILVGFGGSSRTRPTVTRTKDEARQRADELLARLRAGSDFAELARAESDSPSAPRGGDLGSVTAQRLEPTFAAAAFALEPGETSAVVETPFGFHIIKRTK
jgi:NIMA-interacting peptidyl-prolyl cis-trans isomerase 1